MGEAVAGDPSSTRECNSHMLKSMQTLTTKRLEDASDVEKEKKCSLHYLLISFSSPFLNLSPRFAHRSRCWDTAPHAHRAPH